MKTEISQNEYLQLVGLMTLVLDLTKDDDVATHVDDEVWGTSDGNIDALLKRLNITVQPKEVGNA